jgi:membrane protease YdiL (CAAX protease family)
MIAAIFGSAALFAVGHLYQGRPGVMMTFLLGLIFASIRVWTGTLIPCVMVHLVVDSVAGIAGPKLLQRADSLRMLSLPPDSGSSSTRTATDASN